MDSRRHLCLLCLFAVSLLVFNKPSFVRAGDIVHGDDRAPKKPGCENDFVLVKVQTWIDGIESSEFVGVGARFGTTIVSKEKNANYSRLTLSDPRDCCVAPKKKLSGDVIMVDRGNCKFTTKANVAEAAGASAVLIVNNQRELYKMVCEPDETDLDIHIPAIMLPQDAGISLEKMLMNSSSVSVQLYSPLRPVVDIAEVFLWLMAVGTILCASYWSAWTAREDAIEQEKLLHDSSDEFPATKDFGTGGIVDISTKSAVLFVVLASGFLVILYFCMSSWLIDLLVVLFAIGGAEGLQTCSVAILSRFRGATGGVTSRPVLWQWKEKLLAPAVVVPRGKLCNPESAAIVGSPRLLAPTVVVHPRCPAIIGGAGGIPPKSPHTSVGLTTLEMQSRVPGRTSLPGKSEFLLKQAETLLEEVEGLVLNARVLIGIRKTNRTKEFMALARRAEKATVFAMEVILVGTMPETSANLIKDAEGSKNLAAKAGEAASKENRKIIRNIGRKVMLREENEEHIPDPPIKEKRTQKVESTPRHVPVMPVAVRPSGIHASDNVFVIPEPRHVPAMPVAVHPSGIHDSDNVLVIPEGEEQDHGTNVVLQDGPMTRAKAKGLESLKLKGVVEDPGHESDVVPPKSKKDHAVSVMMADVEDDPIMQAMQDKFAKFQELLDKKNKEMEEMAEQMKAMQVRLAEAEGTTNLEYRPQVPGVQDSHLDNLNAFSRRNDFRTGMPHPTPTARTGNQDPSLDSLNPTLMSLIDELVKKHVQKMTEKEDGVSTAITKPYPAWVDKVSLPLDYPQPEFRMFNGTGDPRQHLAHFLSRCGPIARNEALCLQLFVQSLEDAAFTWYSQLPEGSIPSWDAMAKEFLKHFCNTQRRVGVPELIETKQRDSEPVTNFIARWRALTFTCPQKFTQKELIRMCMNNFRHELSTSLMAQTFIGFNDLCTKAHDMELHLNKQRRLRFTNKTESLATTIADMKKTPVIVGVKNNPEIKNSTIRETMEKKYSFSDDLVEEIFEDLLEHKLVSLPEVKRPHEVGKIENPKYCPYHRLISHSLRDCLVLKDKIQELLDSKIIELPPS